MFIPYNIQQGDSITLSFYHENYNPAEWTLKLSARGFNSFDITYNDDGNNGFTYTISPVESSAFAPGYYNYSLYAENLTDRTSIEVGTLKVSIDILAITDPVDIRSHAKKVLDAIESVIEGVANTDAKQMILGGRQLTRYSHKELLELRSKYKSEYELEEIKSGRISGKGNQVKVSL